MHTHHRLPASLLLLLFLLVCTGMYGTPSAELSAGPSAASAPRSGEKLSYTLYFNWKFVWIKAGQATLSTTATTYEGAPAYKTTLLASTGKNADAIFHMRDTLTTIVQPDGEPLYFVKHCEEGKDVVCEQAWFTRTAEGSHRVRAVKRYTDGRVREGNATDKRTVYDMLSLLGHARAFDASRLTVGQRLVYPMVSGRHVEEQVLAYLGKETIETLAGTTVACHVFSLVQPKTKDGVTTESEVIRFYISADARAVPVQLDLFLKFGVAKVRMNEK